MSDINTVKRGICTVDDSSNLQVLEETFNVQRDDRGIINGVTWDGKERENIDEESLANMNMFCFHPNIFKHFEKEFEGFLKENDDPLEGEYIMAVGLNNIVKDKKATIRVIRTPSNWFGVTNPEDGEIVRKKIKELIDNGDYPENLWN